MLTISVRQKELVAALDGLVQGNGGRFPYGEATRRYGLNENTIWKALKNNEHWKCSPVSAMRFALLLGEEPLHYVVIDKDGAHERHNEVKLEDL